MIYNSYIYFLNWFQRNYLERKIEPIFPIQKDKKNIEEKDNYIKTESKNKNE